MYIFIENNNIKNGKKRRKEKKKGGVGLEPGTFGSTRLHLTTILQRLIMQPWEKVFNLMPFPSDETLSWRINRAINSKKKTM